MADTHEPSRSFASSALFFSCSILARTSSQVWPWTDVVPPCLSLMLTLTPLVVVCPDDAEDAPLVFDRDRPRPVLRLNPSPSPFDSLVMVSLGLFFFAHRHSPPNRNMGGSSLSAARAACGPVIATGTRGCRGRTP